jgi:hypothetical protein
MTEDINQISNNSGIPIITPPFSHLTHQNQHLISNNKRDDDHLFLHPSCIPDTYITLANNGNNNQQQTPSVRLTLFII